MAKLKKSRIRGLIVDLFSGGGGASMGIKLATGREPDVAINHDKDAIAIHQANHPGTRHLVEDVWKVNPHAATRGRRVGLLWASPDCRHFSRAKGSQPVKKSIRSLAWVVVKWAAQERPEQIYLENVREFADWGPIVPAWRCGSCHWRGTEGQAVLKRSARRCPRCDSKRLKVTDELIPDPSRKGLTFKRFCGRLRNLGYVLDHKNLNAADFGVPTHRRRLFLVARRDGKPIEWPEPTHADPKKLNAMPLFDRPEPYRTAAECIDWSIPCPSIFDRPRGLAEATLRRIALGIKRYVLDNPQPFIVGAGGPAYGGKPRGCDQPIGSVLKENHSAIVTPLLARIGQTGAAGSYSNPCDSPLTSIVSKAEHLLIAPVLCRQFGKSIGSTVEGPAPTTTAGGGGKSALVAAFLAKHYGGVVGHGLNETTGTITAKDHHSLCSVFLAKHFGDGHVGAAIDTPFPTITQVPNQNQIVAANLIRMNHGDIPANGVDEPLRTITSQTNKFGLVYSFLIRYFGTAIGQHVTEPLFTITGKDRFGLVLVEINGETFAIVDIGMRMLTPRELSLCQGFPRDYILAPPSRPKFPKSRQVAMIGNSVCPGLVEQLIRANNVAAAVAV